MKLKFLIILSVFMGGCASSSSGNDPMSPLNKAIFSFNAGVDKVVMKPVAKGYRWIAPGFVETGVSNFFANLEDVPTAVNNLLQGKPKQAGSDSLRFLMNSTLGLGGLIDVASEAGLEKHDEDLGQTLAVWGVPSGPYLMLPLLGPSTLRDALSIDYFLDPSWYFDERNVWDKLIILEGIDARANLLDVEDLLDMGLYDDYEQMKEIYLQRRARAIADGAEDEDAGDDLRRELEMLEDD